MKIVKCSKCMNYIHKAARCFHCGSTTGFEELEMPAIHERAAADYFKVDYLVESKKYDEALALSHHVIEWMPDLAGIFWLRVLAKNRCANAEELIRKGFNCEEDADFCNAMTFSTGAERSAYQHIQAMVLAIRKALKAEILDHEIHCKMNTNLIQLKNSMKSELDARKKKLFALWSELEATEQSMYMLEKDCLLLAKEYSTALEQAAGAASTLKAETYRLEECTAEQLHKYHIKIGAVLQQSEQAKDALSSMKTQHPKVKSLHDLEKKRDEQLHQISRELSSLRSYEASVQQTLEQVHRIAQNHRAAVRAVEAFDFLKALDLLGSERYSTVLRSIELSASAPKIISFPGRQPNHNH